MINFEVFFIGRECGELGVFEILFYLYHSNKLLFNVANAFNLNVATTNKNKYSSYSYLNTCF